MHYWQRWFQGGRNKVSFSKSLKSELWVYIFSRQLSGAMIRISNCEDRDAPANLDRTITITGNAESVALAQYLINMRSVLYFFFLVLSYFVLLNYWTNKIQNCFAAFKITGQNVWFCWQLKKAWSSIYAMQCISLYEDKIIYSMYEFYKLSNN